MHVSTKWRTLLILAVAELLAMSLWFSASAVMPALSRDWGLTPSQAGWLTTAVQIGFVAGALTTALLNVADLFPPPKVIAAGALLGAAANAAIPAFTHGLAGALPLRFVTGFALAAVYPPGMKIMATWTKEDRGLGIGLLVGALTVGSALPHLVRALGGIGDWRPLMYAVSAQAAAGALIAWFGVGMGPYHVPARRLVWRHAARAWSDPGLRLANLGYLGHMWELYAMWTWAPAFLAASFRASGVSAMAPERLASFAGFGLIAAGGLGSFGAGWLADRWGRSRTTILSMVTSGTCALTVGLLFGAVPAAVIALALVWGFAVVADSAQFSTAISELSEPEYVGTALAMQTAMGFLLTMASIQLTPLVMQRVGWANTFPMLALGPAVGTWAMWRLKRSAAAAKLAGGRG